jgi:uracil-DNA glycosylase family 4
MLAEMGIPLWLAPQAEATVESTTTVVESSPPSTAAPEIVAAAPVACAPPATSHFTGVSTMDWSALRAAVADCRACNLCESRTQTVFGVGHRAAHWMIVGEAPGEQEDRLGEPFVGKSGQLLDNMLRALGLSRSSPDGVDDPSRQVFIANTLKCRPPGNRNPLPEELNQCQPYLVRQIELVRPKIIVAMGRFAVQSLLRTTEPIGKLRGRVHQFQGVPLIVTYHPAYLLRNLEDKAKAWDDLCLARITHEGV